MSFGYVTKSVVSLVKSKRTELTGLCDLLALGSSAWYDAIMPYFFENYISLKNVKKKHRQNDPQTHFFLRQTCTTITNYENSVVNWIVKARLFAILVWSGKNIDILRIEKNSWNWIMSTFRKFNLAKEYIITWYLKLQVYQ